MGPSGQRHERTSLILYGSETGNAHDVAEELGRFTERLHFLTRVFPLDAVDLVGGECRSSLSTCTCS